MHHDIDLLWKILSKAQKGESYRTCLPSVPTTKGISEFPMSPLSSLHRPVVALGPFQMSDKLGESSTLL